MMKSIDAAVVHIHELHRASVRPRSALREFRKISELDSGLTAIVKFAAFSFRLLLQAISKRSPVSEMRESLCTHQLPDPLI
jgi:hypothetical protein